MKIKAIVLVSLLISFLPLRGQRIVSLAPALTEIIADFGLVNRLVGRTKFCDYPPKVQQVPAVGGVIDLNLEFIYRLQPDYILCYQEQLNQLKPMGKISRVIGFKHRSLNDLQETILSIGRTFNLEKKAQMIIARIKEKLQQIRKQVAQIKKKRILFVVSREGGSFKNLIITGNGDFLGELIDICGAENAYQGDIAYPSLSVEGVIALNPDVLIEYRYQEKGSFSPETLVAEWQRQFRQFNGKCPLVRVITDPVILRLGSRIGIAAEQLTRIIHGK